MNQQVQFFLFFFFLKIIKDFEDHRRCFSLNEKCKQLVVFDYMIADMLSNKKLEQVVNELFIRGRKLNTSVVFITQPYFVV